MDDNPTKPNKIKYSWLINKERIFVIKNYSKNRNINLYNNSVNKDEFELNHTNLNLCFMLVKREKSKKANINIIVNEVFIMSYRKNLDNIGYAGIGNDKPDLRKKITKNPLGKRKTDMKN